MKRRALLCCTVVAAVSLLAPARAQQPAPYRILITNDDGVRAPGLAATADALKAIGEVVIVAPSDNQSGSSQSLNTSQPASRQDITLSNGLRAIGLTATPATTVQIAIKNIVTPRPDLVVSGVNAGYNLGTSTYLSGTVGAARQGAMEGVAAIAASMAAAAVPRDFAAAAREVANVARRVREHRLPRGTFLNVNIPPMADGGYKGYRITTQAAVRAGTETFAETKRPGSEQTLYWSVYAEGASAPQGTDIWAVNNGFVSVTPMHLGEYDENLAGTLTEWFK